MHRPTAQSSPPFDAPAARRLRTALGMALGQAAADMRLSYGLPHITPELIDAWERGLALPTAVELTALAGVLWCAPGELIGTARTLREHRMAHGWAPQDLALAIGMDLKTYLRMEETGDWHGNERQSAALAEALALTRQTFCTVTGRDGDLAKLLRSAVTTRWAGFVRPVAKLVPVERRVLSEVLERLHDDYQSGMVATLAWGDAGAGATESGEAGRVFLQHFVEHFWAAVEARDD